MKDTHILVFEHDILKYPPILSIIDFLFSENQKVILLGYCIDDKFLKYFREKGGEYFNLIENDTSSGKIVKILRYKRFQKKVKEKVFSFDVSTTKVWLFGEQCSWMLHDIPFTFDCNIYLFETSSLTVSFKYRLIAPKINYKQTLKAASNVICCEYNRAHLTRSLFNLDKLPVVIPNKPFSVNEKLNSELPTEILNKIEGKKMILYQGVFNYPERKLDEFCESINYLPDDFIICLMGSENPYKQKLQATYESNRVLFLPYMSAPSHLLVTRLAYIGILVYNGDGSDIKKILNTLYCAPNKVFEYSKYSIPMISNDIPALQNIFQNFKNGICIEKLDPQQIAEEIVRISMNYNIYANNSKEFYDSIDLIELYKKVK